MLRWCQCQVRQVRGHAGLILEWGRRTDLALLFSRSYSLVLTSSAKKKSFISYVYFMSKGTTQSLHSTLDKKLTRKCASGTKPVTPAPASVFSFVMCSISNCLNKFDCSYLLIWSWYLSSTGFLLSFMAAVTRPESGVHSSKTTANCRGTSNFSKPWISKLQQDHYAK